MTDMPVDASPEDVADQLAEVVPAPVPLVGVIEPPLEADPADVADQLAEVPLEDDDWR